MLSAAEVACAPHSQLFDFPFPLTHLSSQSQVLNYEKEVENLSRVNHDKTEQLESLKEENRRLRVSRTQEVELSLSTAVHGGARAGG